MNSNHFDVIVVGGGPAGSSTASLLARSGLKVLLLEKACFPRDKICGDCINPRAWQYFDLLGVSDQLRRLGLQHISSVQIVDSSGKEIRFSVFPDPSAPLFALKRRLLDKVLLDCAREAGTTVKERAAVVNVDRTGNWNVTVQMEERLAEFSSPYLIGADGRNSLVARRVDARHAKHIPQAQPARVGVQWHASFVPGSEGEIQLRFFHAGYCGIVRVDQHHSNIAMVATPDIARLAQTDFYAFLRITGLGVLHAAEPSRDLTPIETIETTYPINPILRNSSYASAFLVGDAHRTFEPFTGEGVYRAMSDGARVARRILRLLGIPVSWQIPPERSAFWTNTLFSRVLRNNQLSRVALALISLNSALPRIVAISVFGSAVRPRVGRI